MAYDIRLPDGTLVQNIPDDVKPEDAKRKLLSQFPDLAPKNTGFGAALKSGLEGVMGAGAGIALGLSPENAQRRAAVEASQRAQEEAYSGPSFQDVENAFTQEGGLAGLKSLAQFGKGAIGQSLPYMAAPLAGGRLGALAGGALAGPAGAAIGGIGGAGLASAAQFFGTNIGRQVQEGQPVNPGAAAAAAIPQAALDVGTLKFAGLGRIFGMEGKQAAEKTAEAIVTSYKKGVPLHMVKGLAEVPTEVAQQVLERAQAGKDLTSPDAFDEYKASAAAAGLMGPAMGGVGGVSQVRAGRVQAAQEQAHATQEAAAQAATARQEDQTRRQAFQQQMGQMDLAALGQRMDELRAGSKAYAPLDEMIRQRQEAQAQAEAAKAQQSAFTTEQPNLFGEFRPEQVSQVVTPEATLVPTVPEGQMALPLTNEQGQQGLFPGMVEGQAPAPQVEAPPLAEKYELGPVDFARFGFSKNAGIRKRLAGVDVMTREGRNKFQKEVEKFDNGQRTANWDALTQFQDTLPPLEQDVLGLEGGYAPTQANEVRALNTEAPQAAVRPRYDAQGNRIIPPGPTTTLKGMQQVAEAKKTKRQIGQEQATREFMFGQPATPAGGESLSMMQEPKNVGIRPEPPVGGGSEPSVGVPEQRGAEPAAIPAAPVERAVEGTERVTAPNNGEQAVRVGALEEPTVALPTEAPKRKGGRKKMALEDTPEAQVSQAITALEDGEAFPGSRQTAVNDLYRVATDHPNTEAGQRAAARLDQEDITTDQTKQADKVYRGADTWRFNKPKNPDKFSATLPDTLLDQPVDGHTALTWLAGNAKNSDIRSIAAKIANTVDLRNVRVERVNAGETGHLDPRAAKALESALGIYGSTKGGGRVYIRDDGQNEVTLLHELTHAATEARLRNPSVLTQFRGLMDKTLQAARAKYANGKETIPESVRFFGDVALTDPDEFVAYGFSSPTFRAWLDTLGPQKNLWDKFVDTVRRVLGLSEREGKTLKAAMDAMLEPLLEAKPIEGGAPAIKSSIEASPTADLYERTKRIGLPEDANQSFFDKIVDKVGKVGSFFFDSAERSNMLDAFRNKNVFYGAAVENRLQRQFNGAIMDAAGQLRPDINLLQALHADNLGAATLFKGKLTLDKEIGGWWKATEDKDSMSAVFKQVHDLEKKIGEEEARHATQVFLLAARSDALNKANAEVERNAQGMEARGKKKEAAKLRDDKLKHVHLTDDEIAAGLEYGKIYPELRGILDTYTGFKNNLIDSMVESGRFGKAQAEDLKAGIDYVPFHRIQEEEQAGGPKEYFRGLTDLGKLHKFTGSEKPVDNILDNMVQMSMWMVNNAVRNHAAVRLADALALRDARGNLITRDAVAPGKGAVTVPIYIDGKRKFVEMNDPLEADAFKGVEPVSMPIIATLAKFSDLLRKGTTVMPNFLVSQVIQDSMRAATMSGVKSPGTLVGKTLSGFVSALGKKDPILSEMESYGIAGAYDFTPGAAKEKAERELGLKRRGALQKFMDAGERVAVASDSAQRRAIYDQTLKETGDKSLALYRAMEIINFKRQGSSQNVNALRRLVPFMNAYIQGMDVLGRTMFGKGIAGSERKAAAALFWKTGMKVAALSTAYAMMMGGDDEYEKQDDRTKARNFFLPGTGVKLPVPSDIGFFFKIIPELAYNYITSQGTDTPMDATKLRTAVGAAMNDALLGPNLVPQAIKPTFEVAINHSFFTGNPIIGRGIEKKETSQQFTENTSEMAKFLGQTGLISPMNVDHLVRGTLGSVGGLLLTAGDSLAGAILDNPRPTLQAYRTPIISTFLSNPEGRGLLQDYYDLKDKSDTTFNTLQSYVEQRDIGGAKEYLEKNKELLATRPAVGAISGNIAKLRTLRKAIIADSSLSGDEKRAKLDEIDAAQNRMLANIAKLRQASGL